MRVRIMGGVVVSIAAVGLAAVWLSAAGQAQQQTQPQKPTKPPVVSAPGRDASPAPAGTGAISGMLVNATTGRPIRFGRVSVSAPEPRFAKSVTTDDQGRFSFAQLPAGLFDLSASRQGYLDVTYGQKQPGNGRAGTPIQLVDGQQLQNVKLAMPKGGVITGTILDDQGEPSFGTQVRAMRYVLRGGERVLQSAGSATTDDRGIYRIPMLLPGDYVISVTPQDSSQDAAMKMRAEEVVAASRNAAPAEQQAMLVDLKMSMARAGMGADPTDPTSAYAPVYFPGTTVAASAATVTIGPSEERASVDVPLQLVPVARVNGTVAGVDGAPAGNAQIQLIDLGQPLPGMGTRTTTSGADGRFSFSAVPPGQYSVTARLQAAPPATVKFTTDAAGDLSAKAAASAIAALSTSPGISGWASADVSVDGRAPSAVSLMLRPGATMTGRVVFDGSSVAPDPSRVRVALTTLAPPMYQLQSAAVDANGNFTIPGVMPGKYAVTIGGAPQSWKMKSVMAGGRDALDFLLEAKPGDDLGGIVATLTDKTTLLQGALQNANGQAAVEYSVVAYPTDTRFWTPQSRRIQSTRPATDGTFTFRDLPPGDYAMIAVTDLEPGQALDPNFLKQIAGSGASVAFKLAEGERKTQALRVK